jgi:NAD(P)-dependent dehydrogenase (short-subunit alcohol dehydrogenase family)
MVIFGEDNRFVLGGTVLAVARGQEKLQEARSESVSPGRFHPVSHDLSADLDSLPEFMKSLAEEYGNLRALVHSAGMIQMQPLKGLVIEDARELFDLNYFAALSLAKGFQHRLCNSGAGSSMVFISSISAVGGHKGIINYSASKGAVSAMVRPMALELAAKGIRVNSVVPGHIHTGMAEGVMDSYSAEYREEVEAMYPLGPGRVTDVADLVAFLVSDSARWITGQNIIVDGGRTLL